MSDDLKIFRELVLWLWETHEKPWEYSNKHAQLIIDGGNLLNNCFTTNTELEAYLPSEDKVTANFDNRYFFLNPITVGQIMVPRIQLTCNFGRNLPEIRCRLELFLLDNNADIQSLGYRFESPEGQGAHAMGLHHYYHVQMIQPPTATTKIDWLPEKQPAFPIDADDPVKMLLALLISLYGLEYLGEVLKEAHNIWQLDKYINNFHYTKFGAFEWYKIVEVGNPIKHFEGYKINSKENGFDAEIRRKYAGCDIKGITSTTYDALDKGKKNIYP